MNCTFPVSDPAHPTPTFLTLLSADTDHSFWVPRLAGKTDLIPNHPNSMWVDPHETGLYLGQCAQYCGTQHAKMLLRVYVRRAMSSTAGFSSRASRRSQRRRFGRAEDLRTDGLRQLPRRGGHRGKRALRPRSDPSDEPRHIASGAAPNTPENLRRWIQIPTSSSPDAKCRPWD
jgi:cytochrome c oxidase subunit 2